MSKKKRPSKKGDSHRWSLIVAENPQATQTCSGCNLPLPLAMYHRAGLLRCKNCIAIQRKAFRIANQERIHEEALKWRTKNREFINAAAKEYRQKNKTAIRERNRAYVAKRRQNEPRYRLQSSISRNIAHSLKQRYSSKSRAKWQKVVGYTLEELTRHLEALFTEEMTWENYGTFWHIDHIVPQSWFKFATFECAEFRACWALTNLQPLEATKNMSKQNRWVG
jgi:hypothetical protein